MCSTTSKNCVFSETGGLGVKMVEYVLGGSSPTTPKDLDPRMVSLRLVSNPNVHFFSKSIH